MNNNFAVCVPQVDQANYTVLGHDCQILTMSVKPGEHVVSEPGAMMFMSDTVNTELICDGCCERCCSGEACCQIKYTNNGSAEAFIGLSPNFPAKVIPIQLGQHNNNIQAKAGAYFSNAGTAVVTSKFDLNPLRCCCARMGCIYQNIAGDGVSFLSAGGTILTKTLAAGELLVVDNDTIVAWDNTVEIGVRFVGHPLFCCLGGEGCFNATMTGPGTVYLQSMSFGKWLAAVVPKVGSTSDAAGAAGAAAAAQA